MAELEKPDSDEEQQWVTPDDPRTQLEREPRSKLEQDIDDAVPF